MDAENVVPSPFAHERVAFLVVGPHRSGASAMARTLALAGFGELPIDLPPPQPADNSAGFWQSRSVVELNEALLAEHGGRWDQPAAPPWSSASDIARIRRLVTQQWPGAQRLVIKDPRISLLLPAWRAAVSELAYRPVPVLMLRHPAEATASMVERDGLDPARALALWSTYLARLGAPACEADITPVAYDDLLTDWRKVLSRIAAAAFGRPFQPTEPEAAAVQAFLAPGPKRRFAGARRPSTQDGGGAFDHYEVLLARSRVSPPPKRPFQKSIGTGLH